MLLIDRQSQILELLQKNKSASIDQIAAYVFASSATVRRDLKDMEKQGKLRRTRGGAVLFESSNDEPSANVRMAICKKEKERVAALALPLLESGKTYFFDASSTVCVLSKAFAYRHKTVITHGLTCASILSAKDSVNVIITGGNLSYNSNAATGALTMRQLDSYQPDIAVVSCGSLSENAVGEATSEICEIKKKALSRSAVRILLVTADKFDKKTPFVTCAPSYFDYIVSDSKPPESIIKANPQVKFIY